LFSHFYFSKGVLIFVQQNNPDANQFDWYLDFSLGLTSQALFYLVEKNHANALKFLSLSLKNADLKTFIGH